MQVVLLIKDKTIYYMKAKLSIEKLLAKYFLGEITDIEKEELDKWSRSSPQRELFFNRLCADTAFSKRYETYSKIDSKQAWIHFQKRFCKRAFLKSSFFKYAAILLLPLLIGMGGWYIYSSFNNRYIDNLSLGDSIHPGITQATLIAAKNNKLSLTPASTLPVQVNQSITATIQDGTLIYPSSNVNTDNEDNDQEETIENNILTTEKGNEFKVNFEDGTTVHLNYNTQLRYPVRFSKKKRIVYLKGEAYFKIAKDSRPFYVMTDQGTIKQYGTEFNANTFTPQRTEVVLVKGSISLISKEGTQEHIIKPGQLAYTSEKSEDVVISNVDVTPYIAWNQGRFIFENRSLKSIVEILEHWYNVKITFGSPKLKQLRFTGNMDRYDTITTILKAIARTTNLHIHIKGREILITDDL